MKMLFITLACAAMVGLTGCGGTGGSKTDSDSIAADTPAFVENQPLESGQYDATAYDIKGDNARSGKFDGRILFSLSPEQSAIYVYENGNRAKIDYLVMLAHPFEKGDSGIYVSADNKGKPVTVSTDSVYTLRFEKGNSNLCIEFDKTPRSTSSAIDVLQRIQELKSKQ